MAVVATGFFDGVHLGHRRVLSALSEVAERRGEQAVVVTFWPHPRVVLGHDAASLRLLCTAEERMSLLREALPGGTVHTVPFTRDFASMTAAQYLQMLVRDYGATYIVLGHDNRFGSDGLGTGAIAALARSMGLGAEVVEPLRIGSTVVSSTAIRKALQDGDAESASAMLGRPSTL